MARPKYILIEGPTKEGTKVPRPGRAGTFRLKSGRFYNSNGYEPGKPFARVVPLDPHHMGLIADMTVTQKGGYMNADQAEAMRAKLEAKDAPPAKGKGKGK